MLEFFSVTTTFENKQDCVNIAKQIIDKKLASCCQITKIESFYFWESTLTQNPEFKLESKTLEPDKLVQYIKENHTYDLPEIVVQKLQTTPEYYEFLAEK